MYSGVGTVTFSMLKITDEGDSEEYSREVMNGEVVKGPGTTCEHLTSVNINSEKNYQVICIESNSMIAKFFINEI